jgi:hypothetical protein
MASITNQTNIEANVEANVAVVDDYESWEERVEDDDTISTISDEGEPVMPEVVAGAEVSDVSFPLPGAKVEAKVEVLGSFRGGFAKKDVKERFLAGPSITNEQRSKAFEMLEDRKKGGANLLKTKMCRSTETGEACPHGDRCRFAHTLSELRISECFFGDRCRFVRRHRNQDGIYFNNAGKFCNHLHPGETQECFFKRTGKEMPVVVPPKKVENVEKNVVDIPKNESKNDSKNNSVWAPKPKLVYKQPSPEEIQELQMKRLAELEEQRQEAEANKLADELEEIINEGIKDVKEVEPELVLRVSESGYMSALEMAMKSGRTNVRVEIV